MAKKPSKIFGKCQKFFGSGTSREIGVSRVSGALVKTPGAEKHREKPVTVPGPNSFNFGPSSPAKFREKSKILPPLGVGGWANPPWGDVQMGFDRGLATALPPCLNGSAPPAPHRVSDGTAGVPLARGLGPRALEQAARLAPVRRMPFRTAR